MNLKFKIKKLNSDDVIATSGLIVTPTGTCIHLSDKNVDGNPPMDEDDVDYYVNGAYSNAGTYDQSIKTMFENANISPEFDKFYEVYTDGEKSYLYPCKSHSQHTCLAAGTKITMANGSVKNVEDIVKGDEVLTFNHETGKYESKKVFIVYHDEHKATPFTLHFDNENIISIVGAHDFFEKESLKYVTVSESTSKQFIGKHFYSASEGKYLELKSVTNETRAVDCYSIYTIYNENCVANGMLSLSDDAEWTLNYYKFNEDLTADLDALALDLKKYGAFEITNDKTTFNSERAKYVNISIGKGLITKEEWEELYASLSTIEWDKI